MEGIWCVTATCRASQTLSQVCRDRVWAYACWRPTREVIKTFRESTTSPSSVTAHRRHTQSTHSIKRPKMQLSMRAKGLRCSSSRPRQAPLVPVRPGRCRVARVSAEFVKQSDEKPSPQEQQQKSVKPETNGAAAPAAVVETPKPAATQQDALADLQELRSLIDEVRVGLRPGQAIWGTACTQTRWLHACGSRITAPWAWGASAKGWPLHNDLYCLLPSLAPQIRLTAPRRCTAPSLRSRWTSSSRPQPQQPAQHALT